LLVAVVQVLTSLQVVVAQVDIATLLLVKQLVVAVVLRLVQQ
jgi:hypothetical protein